MKIRFFDPGKEFYLHKDEYTKEWQRVREAGKLILQEDVKSFEENFAKYIGVRYCVGVNSGTDAIMMCVKYLKAKRVLVPYYTFKSTVGAVVNAGAVPVFKGKAKVGIVAHIAGEVFPLPKTRIVIEDACQAIGAIKNPKTFAQCWSFYPAKILGSFGDAGAITTNDKDFYEWAKEYRNHFKGTQKEWGGNHRLSNVLASELLIKLKRIDKTLAKRREIANIYDRDLKGIGDLILPKERAVYQDYIIQTNKRDELCYYLKENGIETLKNLYDFPIKKPQNIYEYNGLRLPINEILETQEIYYITGRIKDFYDTPTK